MFRTLRWRLTIWFIMLSVLVYASVATLGMVFFHAGLTNAIDDELQELSRELLPTVDYDEGDLQLHEWPIAFRKHSPIKMLASVQLFNEEGKLVQEYGPKSIDRLLKGTTELMGPEYAKRSFTTPVVASNGKTEGYLQIQLTTRLRDNAMHQFAFTVLLIAPFLLLSLGVCGYIFAGKVTKPIEETFSLLREFISDAGHELQTPLAIISAASENLSVQLEDTPHAQRLNIISRNTDRMGKLVRDLVLLAKVDARAGAIEAATPLQVDKVVRLCTEEFEDRFKEKQIALSLEDLQPATVSGDQDALHRLITNLLENALRYTNEGGKVTVACRNLGRVAKVSVEDTGVGIPAESLPRLFDRFYRVDKSRSRNAGGSGLGLAIVKAIADGHRGYVEVASEPGKGTRFSVVLPIMPV
jgi:two-component system, OmpR family, sensor histidine kinase CiaH